MFADNGHVSKNFDQVFVGAYSPDFLHFSKKNSPTHFMSLLNLQFEISFSVIFCVGV